MTRTEIINYILDRFLLSESYLEIGVSNGENFKKVNSEYKIGVDPDPNSAATLKMTSDDFFEKNLDFYDLIFIDGLHTQEQTKKDIENSLNCLRDGGIIVCHDMNPSKKERQTEEFNGSIWNGTCWKALVQLRQERDDLRVWTIDEDYGCSVIIKTDIKQPLLSKDIQLTYETLEKHRKKLLNLITFEEFATILHSMKIEQYLQDYIEDTESSENNLNLAVLYDEIGQTASALSYYLRTVERTENKDLQYECLLRATNCFSRQGTRSFTVKGILQHAIAVKPKRPEAYYLLSKMYSEQDDTNAGKWFDSYLTASIALEVCDDFEPRNDFMLPEIDYPGEYALLFQKAHSSWWCGLCDESKNLFLDLYENYDVREDFKTAITNNLKFMNALPESKTPFRRYHSRDYDKLKVHFERIDEIKENYSEAFQDMFVLHCLDGKRKGTYLEIGAGNSFYGNNTALLEKDFGWKGISIDYSKDFFEAHNKERKNPCICEDATKIDYSALLKEKGFPKNIDYLQIDCDPPETSLKVLLNIPFNEYKFAVITFEHDYYTKEDDMVRKASRRILESCGYKLVVGNVSPDENRPFEDWWIHPHLVNMRSGCFNTIEVLDKQDIVMAKDYFLKSGK
jgi:SAM-dependent methyltransferase